MAKIDFTKYTTHELEVIFSGAVTLAAPHVEKANDVDRTKWNYYFIEKAATMFNEIQARAEKKL